MAINAAKTKVMTSTGEELAICVEDGKLEQVDTFVYLGSGVRSDADCTADVKSRLAMGMTAMIKLTRMWRNKAVSINTKLRLMKSLVWPVTT